MASVLDLVSWALAADVQPDRERRIGRSHIKLVLVALATYANAATAETFVSAATLGSDLGVSERDVRLCLAALETQGLIYVDRSRKPYRRRLAAPVDNMPTSAGMPADDENRRDASALRRDASGPHPQGDPQGDPQASLHLSDPIKSSSRARAREARDDATPEDHPMHTDARSEQLARVAGLLGIADPGPTINTWATRRADPLRNPTAVLARMPDDEVRKELSRYRPRPGAHPPCPDCNGEGWIYDDPADPLRTRKCTHPARTEIPA